ncbi:MAG: ABC transporter permease [Chloroflexi bacterium]|nr:ABC transporter permease [Chloroflexota bacterium]
MTTSSSAKPAVLNGESTVNLSRSRRTIYRFFRHRVAVIGTVIMLLIILFVSLGTLFYSEADSNWADSGLRLQAPGEQFPLGSDTIGRSILPRLIYGGQISILIGLTSVLVSVVVGTVVGVASGYFGGIVDSLLMRLTEAMLSIPRLLLLLVMAKYFSGKIPTQEILGRSFSGSVIVIVVILGLTSWMALARIMRSAVLSIRETEYVLAAHALGATHRRIIIAHVLPNTLAPVIVAATLGVASAILSEAYISFLGVGVQPPTATWGNMLDGSRQFIDDAPWLWIFPGAMIVLTVMSINFVGDGLRDALDPRSDKKV